LFNDYIFETKTTASSNNTQECLHKLITLPLVRLCKKSWARC